ncbi:unnamed protein product [Timema podura]|uniref:Uncharacterized protein n=1 Tax=Timema podura TaxID=61482 RepID=A0ABN7P3G8_TIMPD|nr:unnamed protein product [Timema podura]
MKNIEDSRFASLKLEELESNDEFRFEELETQLNIAETRCDTLKQQLDLMKILYNDVSIAKPFSNKTSGEIKKGRSPYLAASKQVSKNRRVRKKGHRVSSDTFCEYKAVTDARKQTDNDGDRGCKSSHSERQAKNSPKISDKPKKCSRHKAKEITVDLTTRSKFEHYLKEEDFSKSDSLEKAENRSQNTGSKVEKPINCYKPNFSGGSNIVSDKDIIIESEEIQNHKRTPTASPLSSPTKIMSLKPDELKTDEEALIESLKLPLFDSDTEDAATGRKLVHSTESLVSSKKPQKRSKQKTKKDQNKPWLAQAKQGYMHIDKSPLQTLADHKLLKDKEKIPARNVENKFTSKRHHTNRPCYKPASKNLDKNHPSENKSPHEILMTNKTSKASPQPQVGPKQVNLNSFNSVKQQSYPREFNKLSRNKDVVELYRNEKLIFSGRPTKNISKPPDAYICTKICQTENTQEPRRKSHLQKEKIAGAKVKNEENHTLNNDSYAKKCQCHHKEEIDINGYPKDHLAKGSGIGVNDLGADPKRENQSCLYGQRSFSLQTFSSKAKHVDLGCFSKIDFRNMPFVVGQSTSPSHNLRLNIQQVLSMIKVRPSVCLSQLREEEEEALTNERSSVATSHRPRTAFSFWSAERSHKLSCPLMQISHNSDPRGRGDVEFDVKTIPGDPDQPSGATRPPTRPTTASTLFQKEEECGGDGLSKYRRPEDVWVVEQKDYYPEENYEALQRERLQKRCTCFPTKKFVSYQQILSEYLNNGTQPWLGTNKLREKFRAHNNSKGIISAVDGGLSNGQGRNGTYRITEPNFNTGSKVKVESEQVAQSIPHLPGQGRELRETLNNLHKDFLKQHDEYERLLKVVDRAGGEDAVRQLEALEEELNAKEEEIRLAMSLYQEMTSLKGRVKSLREKTSNTSTAANNNAAFPPSCRGPEVYATATVRLTRLLRTVQRFQGRLRKVT